ncbi:MAG TPA: hypothetical protein VMJ64_10270 [Anaerolineales bacterium]|nr:hypothetical protein [Anaerolineales bacterium]
MSRQGIEFDALEGRLAGTLRPVPPRDEFVQRLRGHIHVPQGAELAVRLEEWVRLMLLFGGILSGTVVVLTLSRALFHLLGRKNG